MINPAQKSFAKAYFATPETFASFEAKAEALHATKAYKFTQLLTEESCDKLIHDLGLALKLVKSDEELVEVLKSEPVPADSFEVRRQARLIDSSIPFGKRYVMVAKFHNLPASVTASPKKLLKLMEVPEDGRKWQKHTIVAQAILSNPLATASEIYKLTEADLGSTPNKWDYINEQFANREFVRLWDEKAAEAQKEAEQVAE